MGAGNTDGVLYNKLDQLSILAHQCQIWRAVSPTLGPQATASQFHLALA